MEVFTLLLVLTALFGHSLANNDAIGYETVQYYYAYRIEHQSGLPAADRRLGLKCIARHGGLCTFGEFAMSIYGNPLRGKIEAHYDAKPTTAPDDSDARFLSENAEPSERMRANQLSKTFEGRTHNSLYTDLVEDMTSVLVHAAAAGRIFEADVRRATDFAEKVRQVRSDASYDFKKAAIMRAMVIGKVVRDGGRYLVYDDAAKTIDFAATLADINQAVADGVLSGPNGDALKKVIRDADAGIVKGKKRDLQHWAAIRAYSDFIEKGRIIAGRVAAGAASFPGAGGAACGSAFSHDPVPI